MQERTTALEGRDSLVEDDLNPHKREITVKEQMSNYEIKMDNMKKRIRRKNVRIMGLPEHSEGPDPVIFLEKWLRDLFGKGHLLTLFCNGESS